METPVRSRRASEDGVVVEHHMLGFNLWSVLRVAVLFYLCVLAVLVGAVSAVIYAVSELGLVDDFERFMRGIGFTDFEVLPNQLFLGIGMVIALWFVSMVVLTFVAAALYNVLARWFGGVSVLVEGAVDRAAVDAPVVGADEPSVDEAARASIADVIERVEAIEADLRPAPVLAAVAGEAAPEPEPPAPVSDAPVLSLISWRPPAPRT